MPERDDQTFRFRRFEVRQKFATMKVCTVATLFGAMAPIRGGERVVDIGTGTGLLALMAAQLGAGRITAIEIDPGACADAAHNIACSPWAELIECVPGSLQAFCSSPTERFDLVISNPPFFERHSKSHDVRRRNARHTDSLSYEQLIDGVQQLLSDDGLFYVLLPSHATNRFVEIGRRGGFECIAKTDLQHFVDGPIKVSALTFARHVQPFRHDVIVIYRSNREYAPQSTHYLRPFLLRFANQ